MALVCMLTGIFVVGLVLTLITAGLLVCLKIPPGYAAQRILCQKGYRWFSILQAAEIRSASGVSLSRLPRAEELETVPEVDVRSIDSMTSFLQSLRGEFYDSRH